MSTNSARGIRCLESFRSSNIGSTILPVVPKIFPVVPNHGSAASVTPDTPGEQFRQPRQHGPPGRTAHSNQAGKGAAKCYSFLQDGRPSQFSPLPRKILPHPQADHLHKPFCSICWDVGLCPQRLRGRRGKRLAGIRNWQVISETPGHHRVGRASQPASACRSTTSRRLDPRGRKTNFQPLSRKTGDPRQPQDKSRGKGHRSKRNRIKFSKMEVILT